MNGRRVHVVTAAALVLGLAGASIALADHGNRGSGNQDAQLRAHLIGYGEVPSLNSTGHAEFTATMTPDQITFTLVYADLSGQPLVAHVHVGQRGVSGGVSFFLCGGGGQGPCPATPSGTVTGTVTAANVIGPAGQGFTAGDLASVEKAIEAGVTYANMHTNKFPGGEIRGQVAAHGGDRGD